MNAPLCHVGTDPLGLEHEFESTKVAVGRLGVFSTDELAWGVYSASGVSALSISLCDFQDRVAAA
jgi:hypothetical protein